MRRPAALLVLATLLAAPTFAQTDARERLLIGGVAVSGRFIVFSHAGDLWRVGMDGGTAEQLTEGPAEDDYPVFSSDGLNLAFSRRGADDWDVYVVGADGGEPRRLTYNPEADIARGWRPDSAIVLFMSHRDEEGLYRLYTVPAAGGTPRPLDFPRGWDGSYAPDGRRLAYVPVALPLELSGGEWPGYRGGMTSAIWLADVASGAIEMIPRDGSNDRAPMWAAAGESVYFVSDRSGTDNLYLYESASKSVTQLTEYAEHGIEGASMGGGFVVFVRDGAIHLFDPRSGSVHDLEVSVAPDSSELRPRTIHGTGWIQSVTLSSQTSPLVVGARGDVLTFDRSAGEWLNLTGTSGVAERDPVMSPDGKWIAYFSDQTGEYELHVRSTGDGSVQRIPIELESSYYRELTWSPNSMLIAFSDRRLALWIANIETHGARRVATSPSSSQDLFHPAWSPDGSWLAYSMYEANRMPAVYLYDVERGRSARVSDAGTFAEHPAFDAGGRYLYFVASNTAGLAEFGWSVLSGLLYRPLVSRRLQLVLLQGGTPSPLLALTGEPNPRADSLPAVPPGGEGRAGRQRPPGPGRVGGPPPGGPGGMDARALARRTVSIPLPERDYAGLAPAGPGALYVLVREWPDSPHLGAEPTNRLCRWELGNPRELVKLADGVDEFTPAGGSKEILVRRGDRWALIPGKSAEGAATDIDLSSLSMDIDPPAEWRQMYDEAWRLMRGYFYDPSFHGRDLSALEDHYATYLPSITRRADLNTLLRRALGQVSVSHLSVRGGDVARPEGPGDRIGLLGADYELEEGRYRITRILRSVDYGTGQPLLQGPLDQPGVMVSEGDYLIAVDGKPVDGRQNLYSQFRGKALTPIDITVAQRDGKNPRTYTVVPLAGENTLRRMNWAERNRSFIDEESRGILGYVYIPSFGARSMEIVFRQLLDAGDRRGLIVDERFNGGGITGDYLIEWLRRRPLYYYAFRQGSNLPVPTNPPPAAQVLLINEADASAAETFALMFKLAGLGKVLGERTMGAGIGPYASIPQLIDGGSITIPNRAAFDPADGWGIENQGVEPEVQIPITPADWRAGRDPQLAAAIDTVLRMIVDNPPAEVEHPEYPKKQ